MGEAPATNGRSNTAIFLAHFAVFLFVVLAASWLRRITLQPDAILQGYLQVVSGPPVLVQAASDAVKQWVYRPTLLNGEPVEVITQIDVNFDLNQ